MAYTTTNVTLTNGVTIAAKVVQDASGWYSQTWNWVDSSGSEKGVAANPVSVSLAVSTLAYSAPPTAAVVGTTSSPIATAAAYPNFLALVSPTGASGNVWLSLTTGTAALVGRGLFIGPGKIVTFGSHSGADYPMPAGAIAGISDGVAAVNLAIQGG
jgi:hypothetical protein